MSCNNAMAFFPANFMFQNPHENDRHPQPPPLLPSCSSLPQDFHGVASFLGKRSHTTTYSGSTSNLEGCCDVETGNADGEEELSDDGSTQIGEKKRRLSVEQVKALEKSFEIGNKLEPERKMQLAKTLNLQPRQVAIWFQNRRARWKTKQLEKDYDGLRRQFENLKAENEILRAQNQEMHAQLVALKSREPTESINLNKETEGSCSNRSDNSSSNIGLDISAAAPPDIDSPLAAKPPPSTGIHFFPPSSAGAMATASATATATATTMQFFHGSSSGQSMVKDENSISNMFCNIDVDQSGFWPWLDQPHFS